MTLSTKERLVKMNTKQIQFNRQKVAALLLAGVVLAATVVGLTWTDVSANRQANWGGGSEKAGFVEYENGLPSWSQHGFIAGRKPGVGIGSSGG